VIQISPEEEGGYRKKDFQKTKDDDIEAFLSKKQSTSRSAMGGTASQKQAQVTSRREPEENTVEDEDVERAPSDEEHEEQIRAARSGRAQAEAHHDVAVLRRKAHDFSHSAAKLYHKYKSNEARRQKCTSRAIAYREKAAVRRAKAKEYKLQIKEYDMELRGAAQGKSDLSPEAVRNKIASLERKMAKQEAVAKKFESKAADQTEKAAKFRTRAAKLLEKSKLHESEARMYGKRADNLEKA